ncbi:hypothetical protein JCM10213_002792 [Rhodosporidiobolus nylandii]
MASPALGLPVPHAQHPHPQPPQRLPPVTLPPADFLDTPSGFNPGRRQSINSDPFLHAFSAAPDTASGESAQQQYLHAPPLPPPALRRSPVGDGSSSVGSSLLLSQQRQQQNGEGDGLHAIRPASPGGSQGGMGPTDGQQPYPPYQQSYPPQHSQPPSSQNYSASVGPASSYRFGGPSQAAANDAPSYFDYSMRRHSLSQNATGTASPPRHAPAENGASSPGLKRKASGEAAGFEDGCVQAVRYGQPAAAGGPPDAKRRTSSITFDKMNGLSLSDASRRDSYMSGNSALSPWEDDRRGSGGSFASQGSQSYGAAAYQPVPPPFEQQQQQGPPGPAWDGQQIGPRGSIARGAYEDPSSYGRRPSIPSVSQMMQGSYYANAPPPPLPSPHPHPPQQYPPQSRGLAQQQQHPAVMVSSVPHTPTDIDDGHSRTASSASYSSIPPNGVPPGPAPWARPPHAQRQNSASSLDPMTAYGPGQGPPNKDSPYSRSPELRVSHKLAERKRRKEMAQLFEDLRDSLPFERGLKASKWEILSKAIDYVGALKGYCHELQAENRSMRDHYNLGPSNLEPPPALGHPDAYPKRPMDPSHSSRSQQTSHEASPVPVGGPPSSACAPFQPHQPSSLSASLTSSTQQQPHWVPAVSPAPSQQGSRPPTEAPSHPSPHQSSISPHSSTFPPHQHQQQHQPPPHQFSYQPPNSSKPNGAQPSPPLSQYNGSQGGDNSPDLPHPNLVGRSPVPAPQQVQQQQ